jgi:hypothetical protein
MPITQAKRDPRVVPLLVEVQENYKMRYHRSKSSSWGCQVEGALADISYAKTKHPGGALAHELLHVVTQYKGYRRIRVGFSTIDQTRCFLRLMTCLDNELQHHKMYPRFVQLGFAPYEFYGDDDIDTPSHLEDALNRPPQDILDILPDYFTLIAPGGTLTQQQRHDFEQRFMQLNGGEFSPQLTKIKSAINLWASATSYDAQPTLREIFMTLQNPCFTWFGYSNSERPPAGFFVDQVFKVEETNAP